MYNPNNDTQNSLFCRLQLLVEMFGLDTQLNKSTDQNSLKVTKVVKPTNKKMLGIQNFRDWCNKQTIASFFPD